MGLPGDIHTLAFIGLLVCIVFFGAGGINQVLRLVDRNKPKPPLHEAYAERTAFESHISKNEARHAQLFEEIKKTRGHAEESAKELGEKLSDEISAVKTQVAVIDERTRATNQSIGKISDKVDEVREAVAGLSAGK